MKTKIFGGIALVAIAAVVALNISMSNQKQDAASMLALANVEALAGGETSSWGCDDFTFNGNTYDCDSHWYNVVGKNWTPDQRECTKTEGIDVGYVNTNTYQGQMVVCTTGDGNCVQNSNCI